MTFREFEELLFFVRDEMLKNPAYPAHAVYAIPTAALQNPRLNKLINRWFYVTKPDMRRYLENRIVTELQGAFLHVETL